MDIVVLFEGAEHRVRLTAATQARQLHKAICATCDVPPSSTLVLTDQHGKVYSADPATLPNRKTFELSLGPVPAPVAFTPWGKSTATGHDAASSSARDNVMEDPKQPFKILLLGGPSTGKSCYAARLKAKNAKRYKLPRTYEATHGVSVTPVAFETKASKTPISCRLWDISGTEAKVGLRDVYYTGADAAIIFFHMGARKSYWDVLRWKNELRGLGGDIPIVVMGVGGDLTGTKGADAALASTPAVVTSTKSGSNSMSPVLYILRRLTGLANLKLKKEPRAEEFEIDWDALTTHICSTFVATK